MGIIKDVLGSALGADQVKNGFNGPRFSSPSTQFSRSSSGQRRSPPPDYEYTERDKRTPSRSPNYSSSRSSGYRYGGSGYYTQNDTRNGQYDNTYDSEPYLPPTYQPSVNTQPPFGPRQAYHANGDYPRNRNFRPLALPQISYGDGQPFLRGYSAELENYGIYFRDFIKWLDTINVAIIPNPEAQIFQKGANIAGWFVPGAASIGLVAAQIGVGVGTAVGHSSAVSKVLLQANLELFLPNGLEICIGKSKDVDAEVGRPSFTTGNGAASPEDRIASYGKLIAPITDVLPPLQNSGRQDPLAAIGQKLGNRDNEKRMRRAQKKFDKGKTKRFDSLEGSLHWVMVRQASPAAMDHWQRMLQDSDAALNRRSP